MSAQRLVIDGDLPDFIGFTPQAVVPTIEQILSEYRDCIERVLASETPFSWESVLSPLEEIGAQLDHAWATVEHLNMVANTPQLRAAYEKSLGLMTDFGTEMKQHTGLYLAYNDIAQRQDFAQLSLAQQATINHALRDFTLAGVALAPAEREQFRALSTQAAKLANQFENNVLDATDGWHLAVSREQLQGLPDSHISLAAEIATRFGKDGYCLSLDFPCYHAVLSYACDRSLRETMYTAFVTRASDVGPNAGQWDNSQVMVEILRHRMQLAKLLDYPHYAALSIEKKMVRDAKEVLDFLNQLSERAKTQAEEEFAELSEFAREQGGIDKLQAWDVAFFSEKLREQRYAYSQEAVREYFPIEHVLSGLFQLTQRLYGVTCSAEVTENVWHEDVQLFAIHDADGALRARFYLDLYARSQKRSGAWMAECRQRRLQSDGTRVIPVAYLNCNFTPATGGKPALLTHDEVLTLFHEFGHGLHHMLTEVDYPEVAGINGVFWDAVELPSQFNEQWCWQPEVLVWLSSHYQTGASLPEALIEKMLAARNFHSAMQIQRQLEFALFDMNVHLLEDPHAINLEKIQALLQQVRAQVSVVPVPEWNRFQHSFAHIFAGGYAAGYYSYKWAEVLASDAFARFEEEGLFDAGVGTAFRECILARGGTETPQILFKAFRGREPRIDALLRHQGIKDAKEHDS